MTQVRNLELKSVYSQRTLLLCGSAANGFELYKVLDLAAGTVRDITVDTSELRERQLAAIRAELDDSTPPYGLAGLESMVSYFLDPHTFVQTARGDIVVSMKQAPYVRLLRLDGTSSPTWPALDEIDFQVMYSSTNCTLGPTEVGVGVTSAIDRLRRYRKPDEQIDCRALTLDVASGTATPLGTLPPFVVDSFHSWDRSPAGFYVGVDMNLSVAGDPDVAGFADGVFDVDTYARENDFPRSSFCVAPVDPDGRLGTAIVATPATACAAHVDFDPRDPSVFYISCHNISKWQQQVIIHGPGLVERYQYRDGELTLLGSFTDPEFLRITSQVPYLVDGHPYLAVTGYPNYLYLIDAEAMTLAKRITLFEHEPVRVPLSCPRNGAVPLYLALSEDGRYAFLTGATTLYVVDLTTGTCVDRVDFCEPGSFVAAAHVALLAPAA